SRFKALTAILPVAVLAGPLCAGPGAAEPDRVAPPQVALPPQPNGATPQGTQLSYAVSYEGRLTVRADRTATEISTKRYKVLTSSAIALVSEQSDRYVQGMETLDIVEAFTEKPDGTRVSVDPSNIVTRDAASGLQSTFTRDLKQRTVIF